MPRGVNSLANPDAIDLQAIDVGVKQKRRRRRRPDKPPMPEAIVPAIAEARKRMDKRPLSPGVQYERTERGVQHTSPHENMDAWEVQIADAFGTRSWSTIRVFLRQLTALCTSHLDDEGRWTPSEVELNAALNIVSGVRPKNEIEAALAAQMVAVHFMTMKIASRALTMGLDERAFAIAGKLARTFVMQADGLQKLKGKRQTVKQIINVNRTEIHEHRTVVMATPGGAETGGQVHEAGRDAPVKIAARSPCPAPVVGTSLPGDEEAERRPVRMSRGER